MSDSSSMVRVPRAWVFMVMGAAIIGAGLASVVMVSWLVPRLAKNETARLNVPQGSPANEPANNRENTSGNAAPGNAPPIKPPPVNPRENANTVPPKEEYPPQPQELPAAARIVALRECVFKVRSKETWLDGTEQSRLLPGDRVRLSKGQLVLEIGGASVQCSDAADLELPAKPDGFLLVRAGRFVGRSDGALTQWAAPQGTVTFSRATVALVVEPGTSELSIASGSVVCARDDKRETFSGPLLVLMGSRLSPRALDEKAALAIEQELSAPREVGLRWDFEGELPCSLGVRSSAGANGTKGALEASIEFAAIGSDKPAEFTPAKNSRLRLWVKTNAPTVRLSFIVGSGSSARTWFLNKEITGKDWQSFDVALTEFRPLDDAIAGWEGRPCGYLQFRMRFEDRSNVMPSERLLIIDEVEIYTPR